ncbi:hypothetical protein [Cellvibrio sp. QJXJ]|uniref:hypothetical protein n=1 Tax=Cellvibrio sp. QJXJ TaxID=2964606 RepID=UPI0021C475B8|nr:hypothetical protein [Cellvibrio sp. QJXJ]UUA75124.1 hypothetical protein NNX04_21960 [Cellvibrio sp. QJXJ]
MTHTASKEELPFILCPILDSLKVAVIPLWFKPKGGGRQCPVILLENVPVGFDTVLEACDFIKRPEGWLIDATDKDHSFWRRIFGDVEYVKKQPIKIYEPIKLVISPPPPSVVAVIRGFSEEHIQYLTKNESVIGIEAVRACKNDALRGAISSRGSWSVIKAAVLDRLTKNPEDVPTFEYVWSTGKAHTLNLDGIPSEITHDLLLKKIIERQRLSAQIESVLPIWYKRNGPTVFIIKADWKNRKTYSTPVLGGPVDIKVYSEVECLAQHLLDIGCIPEKDSSIIEPIDKRIIQVDEDISDWVDNLEIPDAAIDHSAADKIDETLSDSSINFIHFCEVFKILNRISDKINKRVDYSKVISNLLFSEIINQPNIPILNTIFLKQFEDLINTFSTVINIESLTKIWSREETTVKTIINSIALSTKARLTLLQTFSSAESINSFCSTNSNSSFNDSRYWWWHGYTFSRTPSISGWQIFRVGKEANNPVGTGLYSSIEHASDDLYNIVKRGRLKVFRPSVRSADSYIGYTTKNGSILKLSEAIISTEPIDIDRVANDSKFFSNYQKPVLWVANGESLSIDEVYSMCETVERALGFTDKSIGFGSLLRFKETSDSITASFDTKDLGIVAAGAVCYAWAESLYLFCEGKSLFNVVCEIVGLLKGKFQKSDMEIGTEEDLLDLLEAVGGELSARLGRSAEGIIRKAILEPSEHAEWLCNEYILMLDSVSISHDLKALLRGVLLYTAQHRSFFKLTLPASEAIKLCAGDNALFIHAVIRYFWFRLRWTGDLKPKFQAVGNPGDLPYGELFPEEGIQWIVFEKLEYLIGEVISELMKESATSHGEAVNQAGYGAPSPLLLSR